MSLKPSMNTSNSFESSNLWGPGTLPAIKLGRMEHKKRREGEERDGNELVRNAKGKTKQNKSCLDVKGQQTEAWNPTRGS